MTPARDHGGALDTALARYGGRREDWIDLSTGINPVSYPLPDLPAGAWTALPDRGATDALTKVARRIWRVPHQAGILPAPGVSALIARIPALMPRARVRIDSPTYNEHAAAFKAAGWDVVPDRADRARRAEARVIVHPDNPTGALWDGADERPGGRAMLVIDESFCDTVPERTHIALAGQPGVLILKSFGKFWGLAGLRLGFAIGDPALIARLREGLGPWAVSGPALEIGAYALGDTGWADRTRLRLRKDADRLDTLMIRRGARLIGGTALFRLYDVKDAAAWQDRLARERILTRAFPYSRSWLRLGLPAPDQWQRPEAAL